jgi:methylthioribose-1-phosphate isomerase
MTSAVRPIVWAGDHLKLLDQRLLPHEERWLECWSAGDVARAIHDMAVRGAPAIGIAAAYGLALSVQADAGSYDGAERMLAESRPTAVNLRWALQRLRALPDRSADALLQAAQAIHEEDLRQNLRMAEFGAALLPAGARVLTHCNTGALATGGHGTALGVIRTAFAQGRLAEVYATETRPWLQGARLTAWELQKEHIPMKLIADGAAAFLMAQGRVDWVIVGADRIAANGDTANKIGTYALALAAAQHDVKFMVVAPSGTFDLECPSGAHIPIEQRGAEELTSYRGQPVAPVATPAYNPVFDVTPVALITALVCEKGTIMPPETGRIRVILRGSGAF